MRARNKYGGGSRTNIHGLTFEEKVSLEKCMKDHPDIDIKETTHTDIKKAREVWYKNDLYGVLLPKNSIYKWFKSEYNVDILAGLSKKFLPDGVFINFKENKLYIIEVKYQTSNGSVDEKLQTFQFKIYQYQRMMKNLKKKTDIEISVEYIYILNDWFKCKSYKDALDYIELKGSRYNFNTLPLEWIGIK